MDLSNGTVALALAALLGLLPGASAGAQSFSWIVPDWLFRNRPYYDPLVSEPRGSTLKVMLGAIDEYQYAETRGARLGMDIAIGKEIPVIGWESVPATGPFAAGEFGIGIWIPISFHLFWDLHDRSWPIINTDYRFGFTAKASIGLDKTKTLGIRATPWEHESTHVGDELTFTAHQLYPDFERIDVTYEFAELGLSLERHLSDEEEIDARGIDYKVRVGATNLWDKHGFYYGDPIETGGRSVTPSKSTFEPYVEFESVFWTGVHSWQPFLSVDLRDRIQYDYHKQDPNAAEQRQLSIDFAAGMRRTEEKFGEKGSPDLYLRGYYGINPNGQFRSQRDFWMIGIGLHINV